jgi:CheY-like chemotaxis protein
MNSTSYTILLVEDEDNDVQLLRRAFTKANLLNPVQVVNNGDDACAYLAGEGRFADRQQYPLPILVLLDLKLPRKSGLEVVQWIRAQPNGIHRVPIVILTSSRESKDLDRAYDLGANSYLCKPVEFEDLMQLVKALKTYWLITNEKPDLNRTA